MNSSSFCVVIVFGLFALINLCGAQEKCTPGETKMEDCNTCFCTDGGIWGCTLKACDVNIRPKRQDEISKECTPGDKKKLECNDCFCSETGIWACTLKACLTNIPQIDEVSRTKRDIFSCEPGQTFAKDCNTCTCTPDGKNAICTLMACKPTTSEKFSSNNN